MKEVGTKMIVIGKVSDVCITAGVLHGLLIYTLQVNHSQRLSEKPLIPWLISMDDGKILAAHCKCMAGMGETCSHVASLLWAIGAGVESREPLTVTQRSAYWVFPPGVRSVPYMHP